MIKFLNVFFILLLILVICEAISTKLPAPPLKQNNITGTIQVIQLSQDLTDNEKLLIHQAAEEWEKSTNNIAKFIFVDNDVIPATNTDHMTTTFNSYVIRPAKETESIIKYLDYLLGANTAGYYDNTHIISNRTQLLIVRSRMQSDDEYRSVIMHEMGHSLQLIHSNNEHALMYRIITEPNLCITADDLSQFCSIYHCDSEKLNPCVKIKWPVFPASEN